MHDGADENGKKGWFERQQEIIERLAGLSERLSGAKNSELGDVLDELSALTSENEEPTRPTPEGREEFRRTWKERGSKEFGARLSESLARVKSLGEAMHRPSPTDLGLAISHGDLQEVRRLLDAGVEPNSHSASERSQLATALLFGHHEIATLLRKCGAAYG